MSMTGLALPQPWFDRMGRFSWLKTGCFVFTVLPAIWLLYQAVNHDLGVRPVTEATHQTGDWGIRFLLATLAVTPLRRAAQWPRLLIVRRMLGLACVFYISIHFCLYIVDQKYDLVKVASEIVLRFYLLIGFAAFLGLCALGWTSTDGAVKRMGAQAWGRLHKLVYPIAVLGLVHFALQSKRDVTEAMVLGGLFILLMLARRVDARGKATPLAFLGLAAVSALASSAGEALWYGLTTGIDGWRVLAANWDWDMAPRPAHWVFLGGLALIGLRWWRGVPQRGRA